VLVKAGEKGVGRIEVPVAPDKIVVKRRQRPRSQHGQQRVQHSTAAAMS